MSVSCGVECLLSIGFLRWAWKRCTRVGSDDSASWTTATQMEFSAVPRICRVILANYESDKARSPASTAGSYNFDPASVLKRVSYKETNGRSPPYVIYLDRDHKEIILAIRGLNLAKESDYKVLLDNSLGRQMFDGGYVHHGLLKSAQYLLERESEFLRSVWEEHGRDFDLVFAGHSLGSGIAALVTILAVNRRAPLGGIPRNKIRCYAIAPARCMSLNLAVKYADVINSIVLQDDFLPRTATPLEDIFKSIFCLPCLLFLVCLRDTFISEGKKLKDPRRLYAPGRIYHIVERRFCRCGRYPPEVRTAVPVEGRFEHIVLSCNVTKDHAILWIAREAEKAVKIMGETSCETTPTPPTEQKMVRLRTLEREHKDALERAVSLNIPHAVLGTETEPSLRGGDAELDNEKGKADANWDEVIKELFKNKENKELNSVK